MKKLQVYPHINIINLYPFNIDSSLPTLDCLMWRLINGTYVEFSNLNAHAGYIQKTMVL